MVSLFAVFQVVLQKNLKTLKLNVPSESELSTSLHTASILFSKNLWRICDFCKGQKLLEMVQRFFLFGKCSLSLPLDFFFAVEFNFTSQKATRLGRRLTGPISSRGQSLGVLSRISSLVSQQQKPAATFRS